MVVNQLISEEIKSGTPSERILLGGFSQGCVMTLLTAVSTSHKLAGAIGCSGWLALGERLDTVSQNSSSRMVALNHSYNIPQT